MRVVRVLHSSDPAVFPLGAMTADLDSASELLYVSPTADLPFCGPKPADVCGA